MQHITSEETALAGPRPAHDSDTGPRGYLEVDASEYWLEVLSVPHFHLRCSEGEGTGGERIREDQREKEERGV